MLVAVGEAKVEIVVIEVRCGCKRGFIVVMVVMLMLISLVRVIVVEGLVTKIVVIMAGIAYCNNSGVVDVVEILVVVVLTAQYSDVGCSSDDGSWLVLR